MSPRLSLTKSQQQTAAGLDLITLCTTYGADGRLSDQEIQGLQEWSERYKSVELPARAHLADVIARILSDGIVTPAEHWLLFDAVETVLPASFRKEIREQRRVAQQRDQARDGALYHYDFMVAGVRYCGRNTACRAVTDSTPITLRREIGNPYSTNAIVVLADDTRELGYVPETDARHLGPLLDDSCLYAARFKRLLAGGAYPIPIIVVDIFWSDAQVGQGRRAARAEYYERPV